MSVQKVALVTPEYYGSAMVGGLAMMVSGLANALLERGIDVKVIMPRYQHSLGVSDKFLTTTDNPQQSSQSFGLKSTKIGNVEIDHITGFKFEPYTANDISTYIEDSAYRKMTKETFLAARAFSAAVPLALDKIAADSNWVPDVIHLHEWQDASSSWNLNTSQFSHVPVVVTSHNANYIGRVPQSQEKEEGLPEGSPLLRTQVKAIQVAPELFSSLLEMGIFFADAVTTVSPNYAREILQGDLDIDPRVRRRMQEKELEGILNGVDYKVFNPSEDGYIFPFNLDDAESFAYGKGMNKLNLHRQFGITPSSDVMQVTMMSRLVEEKGINEVIQAVRGINELKGVQLLVVGEPSNVPLRGRIEGFSGNAKGYPNFVRPELQHLILAGSDAILMPSENEPCGYTQLEGMRYGAVPITTHVGGLVDTVKPYEFGESGYGFIIKELTPKAIVEAVRQAHELYQKKHKWLTAVGNALDEDFSWTGPRDSVGKYIELYNKVMEKKSAK